MRDAFSLALADATELLSEGAQIDAVLGAHSDAVDEIVRRAFADALASQDKSPAGVALVALGGYGRRELAPGSDLDVLLVHRGWSTADIASLNRELMYPLWDAGREVGARVGEPRDVARNLGRADEAAALLDARLLAGDAGLFAEAHGDVMRRLERGRASFFSQLAGATQARHARYGHTGHLLEPNVRDGAGGLRDIQTVVWAAKLLPGGVALDDLVASGILSELDRDLLVEARGFLLAVRVRLHMVHGRRHDQLYLEDQDAVAPLLGFEPDALMQQLYVHARNVDAVVASFWDRMRHRRARRVWRSSGSRVVGDGCVVRDGNVEVVAITSPQEDPAAWMRVFLRSIREGGPVGRGSLNRLHAAVVSGPIPWTPDARDVFVEILQSGERSIRALEAMDASGFLEALLPEWTGIRCRPQRDLYHRFTVDMHLFATVAELARSRSSDDSSVRHAWSRVGDARALFLAALLHDIGKGRGGDHAQIGERLASDVALRMGLDAAEVEDVAFLVRHHLVLAETAVRRDLNDERTVEGVANDVSTVARLAALFLLTRADSISTGPEAWSSFRTSLVGELYAKVLASLEGRAVSRPARAAREEALLAQPLRDGEVRTAVSERDEAHEFLLVAGDRPGLFAAVCGVLALRGADVHDAEIYTREDGIAVEIFRVSGSHGEIPSDRWQRIGSDVRAALTGELDLDEALRRKAAQERHRRAAAPRHAEARVVVDNDASATHTVVEVHATDRMGLLRHVTRALYRAGCDVSLAKVATYGAQVVDVFYVRDLEGNRITSPSHLASIEDMLRRALRSG